MLICTHAFATMGKNTCLYSLVLLASLVFATVAISQLRGACYQQYIPPQYEFPNARCRHPMGGNPPVRGIFIRNEFTCCRRRSAHGWGQASQCKPCSRIRGFLLPWGEWSVCSKTCGWGSQRRYRYCSNGVCAGMRGRRQVETRACMWKSCCPVDGNWSDWSHWSACSATCGNGRHYRTRSCSSPPPSCGGRPCRSYPREMKTCRIKYCAHWTSWSESSCSVSCGEGVVRKSRVCHASLGDKCVGSPEDISSCNLRPCPVVGSWCAWGSWSGCTASCAGTMGTRKRSRSCGCPKPNHNGGECHGSDGEIKECYSESICPVNGEWSHWSPWSQCSAERCSRISGSQIRKRLCNSPHGFYGGTCKGADTVKRGCILLDGCEVTGTYGKWSVWSPCTATCGACGKRTRYRKCLPITYKKKITIIGEPKIACDKRKMTITSICHRGRCPDGTLPCERAENKSVTTLSTKSTGSWDGSESNVAEFYSIGSEMEKQTIQESLSTTIDQNAAQNATTPMVSEGSEEENEISSGALGADEDLQTNELILNGMKDTSKTPFLINGELDEETSDESKLTESESELRRDSLKSNEYQVDGTDLEILDGEEYSAPVDGQDDDVGSDNDWMSESNDDFMASLSLEDAAEVSPNNEWMSESDNDFMGSLSLEDAVGVSPDNDWVSESDDEFMMGLSLEDASLLDEESRAVLENLENEERFFTDEDDFPFEGFYDENIEQPQDKSSTFEDDSSMNYFFNQRKLSPYEIPEDENELSGEPEDEEIRGCDDLRRAKGEYAASAKGCCELLTRGIQENETNPQRMEECLFLHFKFAINASASMQDEDELLASGRASARRGAWCRYRDDAKLLNSICCLRRDCKQWGVDFLRKQCSLCKGRNLCPPCHEILLNG